MSSETSTGGALPTEDIILQAVDVQLHIDKKPILEDVNFSLKKGEFTYLIGRTGAGKSTLLRAIYADLPPTKGSLAVDRYRLEKIKRDEVPHLRRRLGIVFQDFQLLPDRTVGQNITFAMKATGWTDSKQMKARLTEVLMMVGLSSKVNQFPHQLSGGEQQRTTVARALVNDPVLLIADEPTGNLDPEVTGHIMDILHKINRQGTAVLMATHEYEIIAEHPARVLQCKDGTLHDRGVMDKVVL